MNRFFLLILIGFSLHAGGQVEQTARWEMNTDQEGEVYKIAPADSLGVVIYSKLQVNGTDQIELIRLDTALKQVWKGYIGTDHLLKISHAHVYKNNLFLLLTHQNPLVGFVVIELNVESGKYLTHLVKNIIPFKPTEFISTKGAVLIGGYYNYRPLVLHYSLSQKKSKILPGFFNEPGELNQVKVNTDGSIDIIVSGRNAQKRKCLWIRNYNAEGDLLKTTTLEPTEKKSLIFGRSANLPNGQTLVAGVYGRKNSEYSRGIFVATISPYGEYVTRYYNFADLQNFFRFMRVNQEKRIKKRIERRKIKGKKTRFSYRFLVQELIPYNDQFIMLGEAFYPRYVYRARNSLNNFYGYNTLPGYQYYSPYRNDQIFDGFQYTHAIVIGFDKEGKVRWDNSFEINDARSFQLEQFVKIAPGNGHIDLLYFYQNLIRTKIIQGSDVLEGKTADQIKMLHPNDFVNKNDIQPNRLHYWYGNHLLACGFQNIRGSKDRLAEVKRRVFFINKINYR